MKKKAVEESFLKSQFVALVVGKKKSVAVKLVGSPVAFLRSSPHLFSGLFLLCPIGFYSRSVG